MTSAHVWPWKSVRQRASGDSGAWRGLVDAHLLAALSVGGKATRPSRLLPALLAVGLLAAVVAMAGPTWQKIELPSFKTKDPTVMVLSLAQSMNANDVTPTRLTRAGHKVRDILQRMDGGDVGLVIYSDRPFTAAPLTEDADVIREMLPELSTSLMPVLGNNVRTQIAKLVPQHSLKSIPRMRLSGAWTGTTVASPTELRERLAEC